MHIKKDLTTRLNKISGQIDALKNTLNAEESDSHNCQEVIYQIKAARNALKRVADIYATEYIEQCLFDEKNQDKRKDKIDHVLKTIFNS